jgi:protein involved in polysaccharide export with SLBB domain
MLRLGIVAITSLALTAQAGLAQTSSTLPSTVPALQVQVPRSAQSVATVPLAPSGPTLVTMSDGTQLPVFGSDLFSGAFASARPGARSDYPIQPGDQIAVRLFGAVNSDAVQTVDSTGQLFIQGIGAINVANMPAGQLQSRVSTALRAVYTDAVGVYVNVVNGGTLGVFVTGDVQRAGRYVGSPGDSVLFFLDQAGGIDAARGSFRDITIRRGAQVVGRYDLYDFILKGSIAPFQFQDGDVVFVGPRGALVGAIGDVRNAYAFETPVGSSTITGRELAALAIPTATATSTSVTRVQNGLRNSAYYTVSDIGATTLIDGSTVMFRSEIFTQTISVSVRGDIQGQTAFVVPRGATLSQVLAQLPLDGSDIVREYIHIERPSVATAQKVALDAALDNLERAAITQPTYGAETAVAKTAEIAAIQAYVAAARGVVPDGKVAIYTDGVFNDLQLMSGDVIVLPRRSDVVLVAGEVLSPGAFSYTSRLAARDFVNRAGGFGQNAVKNKVVLRRADGTAVVAKVSDRVRAGDTIVITPNFAAGRKIQLWRDLTQIAFQIATTAAVAINLTDRNN